MMWNLWIKQNPLSTVTSHFDLFQCHIHPISTLSTHEYNYAKILYITLLLSYIIGLGHELLILHLNEAQSVLSMDIIHMK